MWRSAVAYWKALRIARIPHDTTPTPTASTCTPTSASTSGGTVVTVTGTGFMSEAPRPDAGMSFVENVYFGLYLATSFTVLSATQLTAVAPPQGAASGIQVVVNTGGGCAVVLNSTIVYTSYRITEISERRITEAGDLRLMD